MHSIKCRYYLDGIFIIRASKELGQCFFQVYILNISDVNRGVNYSEKSVRRFLGLENPGNFSRDSGIFSPNLRDFWVFFN